jgi:chitosanase
MMHLKILLAILLPLLTFTNLSTSKEIPPSLRNLYNKIRTSGPCTGPDLLKTGFFDQNDGSPPLWSYCQRHTRHSAIYLKGPGDLLANMDVDCDGIQNSTGSGDGRCTGLPDTQAQTAFRSILQAGYGIPDLNTYIHPYVVLGNIGNRPWYRTFDPRTADIYPLSVVAVLCNSKLVYGVWGDVNGDDGIPLVGEASLALATACFGDGVSGSNGWDAADVLYLAFKGGRAVPGPNGVRWDAQDYVEFEGGLEGLGDALVRELLDQVEGDDEDEDGDGEEGVCASHVGDNSAGNATHGGDRGGVCACGFNGSVAASSPAGGGGGGDQSKHRQASRRLTERLRRSDLDSGRVSAAHAQGHRSA